MHEYYLTNGNFTFNIIFIYTDSENRPQQVVMPQSNIQGMLLYVHMYTWMCLVTIDDIVATKRDVIYGTVSAKIAPRIYY